MSRPLLQSPELVRRSLRRLQKPATPSGNRRRDFITVSTGKRRRLPYVSCDDMHLCAGPASAEPPTHIPLGLPRKPRHVSRRSLPDRRCGRSARKEAYMIGFRSASISSSRQFPVSTAHVSPHGRRRFRIREVKPHPPCSIFKFSCTINVHKAPRRRTRTAKKSPGPFPADKNRRGRKHSANTQGCGTRELLFRNGSGNMTESFRSPVYPAGKQVVYFLIQRGG